MDPNANLAEQRELVIEALSIKDDCSDDGTYSNDQQQRLAVIATELAELVDALDEWLSSKDGFLPNDWMLDASRRRT